MWWHGDSVGSARPRPESSGARHAVPPARRAVITERAAAARGHDQRVSTELSLPRRAWAHFEPIHAIVYFAPQARAHFDAAGLRGGWMGYFASRSAPMGAVTAEVVAATFHNFQPAMVRRAIPDAWSFSTPQRVLDARLAAIDEILRHFWGDDVGSAAVAEAADLALQATQHLHPDGRPLFAGHAGLPTPGEPHLALWHACTLLREHRFDGHVASLTGYGMRGIDALLLQVGSGTYVDATALRGFRGWTEDEWSAAQSRLRERGLLDEESRLTPAGVELHAAVERITDRLAAEPWERLGEASRERLFALLRPLAARLEGPGGLMYPNPIGASRPPLD